MFRNEDACSSRMIEQDVFVVVLCFFFGSRQKCAWKEGYNHVCVFITGFQSPLGKPCSGLSRCALLDDIHFLFNRLPLQSPRHFDKTPGCYEALSSPSSTRSCCSGAGGASQPLVVVLGVLVHVVLLAGQSCLPKDTRGDNDECDASNQCLVHCTTTSQDRRRRINRSCRRHRSCGPLGAWRGPPPPPLVVDCWMIRKSFSSSSTTKQKTTMAPPRAVVNYNVFVKRKKTTTTTMRDTTRIELVVVVEKIVTGSLGSGGFAAAAAMVQQEWVATNMCLFQSWWWYQTVVPGWNDDDDSRKGRQGPKKTTPILDAPISLIAHSHRPHLLLWGAETHRRRTMRMKKKKKLSKRARRVGRVPRMTRTKNSKGLVVVVVVVGCRPLWTLVQSIRCCCWVVANKI